MQLEKDKKEVERWKNHEKTIKDLCNKFAGAKIEAIKIIEVQSSAYDSYDEMEFVTDKGIIQVEGWINEKKEAVNGG